MFKLRNFELEIFDLNTNNGSITSVEIYEDDIFIFPSKTILLTQVSKSKEPKISISGEIFITIKKVMILKISISTSKWIELK